MTTARSVSEIREVLPTTMGSAEIRDQVAADVKSRSVFSARTSNVVYLSKLKEVIDAIAEGDMDEASARLALWETLRATGYTPEGGFPDTPAGEVPPALAGSIQDLSGAARLKLIISTQRGLMRGRGLQLRGMAPARMRQAPAWELIRVFERQEPRNWQLGDGGTPPIRQGIPDMRSRWTIAGGKLIDGRMLALKGDPIWGEIGSAGNFDDALDTDHPPFAFNSGMGWREIDKFEAEELGLTGPDGESIAEGLAPTHPVIGTPPPQVSARGADPELVRRVTTRPDSPVAVAGGKMVPSARVRQLRQELDRQAQDDAAASIAAYLAEEAAGL